MNPRDYIIVIFKTKVIGAAGLLGATRCVDGLMIHPREATNQPTNQPTKTTPCWEEGAQPLEVSFTDLAGLPDRELLRRTKRALR